MPTPSTDLAPGVVASDWGWRYAGRQRWAACHLDFTIEPGERVLLLGASGAGKSTLLGALTGVLGGDDEGEEAGSLLVGGKHPTRMRGHVGLVMQDPTSQMILQRIGDDAAFGCENLAVPREQIWPRVRAALDAVDLRLPLDRSTTALSGGQQQRLAIAGALAMMGGPGAPGMLCLDEPTANLDPEGVTTVHDAIASVVADRHTTLVVVEHRVDIWTDLVDRVIVVSADAGLLADGAPREVFASQREVLTRAGVWVPGAPRGVEPRTPPAPGEPLLTTHDLTIGHGRAHPVRTMEPTQVPAGLSTTIVGPNGAGKTTLALTLAGLLEPLAGSVEAAPSLRPTSARFLTRAMHRHFDPARPITWASRDLLTRIGTVFQNPEHQFVTGSVREELAVGLKALGRGARDIDSRVDALLARLHLESLADANPFTLSGGEKRRLSVGTVLAAEPRVIVLDEPTFGQDRATWIDLVQLVQDVLEQGRTVISVTHDRDYLEVLGENELRLDIASPHPASASSPAGGRPAGHAPGERRPKDRQPSADQPSGERPSADQPSDHRMAP
ncbi:ABC transporter ATP-binding protein [Propionibacterium freudenreichii]|uniref:ABC transporter, ATP-binding protein n=2 Tax=Propionibacterium freudenreichii TaxID=1744 RepID=D7GG51_PROFC|nr:ABC transporter ATP-binding protein [Propionibacterium freudenreichii]PWM97299.1 MAG: ABC transporter ATP-binding protein [Propionibacterium sp.]ARO11377.1 ABC transporter ATP-binding protein [Propionibacterium freudenreichii]MCQ1998306.1 energy-coupling factor ABC transporter ATP-binding protein [Propionibacterium freudenreichii]MCT3004990.1 ABC transporter ATP-binding protein [Propionibacterium freudenreichii]MCT3009766.1 ABC transporter ATP-binding protein [Propionibacterium freudenreich